MERRRILFDALYSLNSEYKTYTVKIMGGLT